MNPKIFFISSLLALILPLSVLHAGFPGTTNADRVDEIIALHIQARGGESNWAGVESMRISGQFTHFSVQHPFLTILKRPGLFYSEFHIGHQFVKEGYDGEAGWTIDPWQGFEFPRRVNRAEQNVFYQKAEFATPFFNHQERGFLVEYEGEDNIDGMDMLVLRVTRQNKQVETWYLDAETYLEYKTITQWIDFATPVHTESYYDDFRVVGALTIPFFVERMFTNRHLVTQIEEIELNPEIDSSLFSAPPCKGMQKLSGLEGEWDVKVEMPNRLGNWVIADSTTTSVGWIHRDILQSKIFYGGAFPATNILTWTYHRRDGRYQMSVLNDFFSTTEVFEGNFNDATLVMENIHSTQGENKTPLQYRFHIEGTDYMLMERLRSTDKGETWTVFEKVHFRRGDNPR
jgi:hypothetical protein